MYACMSSHSFAMCSWCDSIPKSIPGQKLALYSMSCAYESPARREYFPLGCPMDMLGASRIDT
eukprot:COSAG05_NODE_13390_length_432_cov_0.933934_1_plen_62_part_10